MQVKMLTSMAGLNHSYAYGDVVEVPDEAGAAWIEAGIAEAVEAEAKPALKGKKTEG